MRAESAKTGTGRHVSRSSNGNTLGNSLTTVQIACTQPLAQTDTRCGRGRPRERSLWPGNSRGKRPLNSECSESCSLRPPLAVASILSEGGLSFVSQPRQQQQQNLQFEPQIKTQLGRKRGTYRRTVTRRGAGSERRGRVSTLQSGWGQESTRQNEGLVHCVHLQPPLESAPPNAYAHAQDGGLQSEPGEAQQPSQSALQQHQPQRVYSQGNTTSKEANRLRNALETYSRGEQTQLENRASLSQTLIRGTIHTSAIREREGSPWVQDENWVGERDNNVTVIPLIDMTEMADGQTSFAVRGGARGRGRSGNSEGGGRGRSGGEGGVGRNWGRGQGGGDGTARWGITRGGKGGRGRSGGNGGSSREANGYPNSYEGGGREDTPPSSLFITGGNDTDMDSEMESERETSNSGNRKEDRAIRFSEGTTGHHRMAKLKASREQERNDLIRRGIIDDPNNRKPLSEALTFVGTCMDMCPLFEREERQFQKSVDKLEIDPHTGLIDPKRAVKAFHRPAAGNESALPSDVRPPQVLVRTLNYLIDEIVGKKPDLMITHGFVRDRTRGIRQDFTLQNYRGVETIDCHEQIARYHILCIHQLAHDDRFVLQQEMEQLQKTMTTLNELYDDAKKDGIACPNEPEFRTYQILIYIHDTECQRAAQRWVFADSDLGVQQALRLHQAAFRNAPRFFNLLRRRETTYLMGCIAEAHLYYIRKEHLRKMRVAYNKDTTAVILTDVERQLGFDHKSDLDRYLEHFGIETAVDGQGEEYIVPNRNFDDSRPQLRPTCNQKIIEVKRQGKRISDVIHGVAGPSIGKFKSKALPFEEDFGEAGSGPMKIQSWVPDEDDPNAMSQNSWQELQGYENALANSSQEFQRDSIPFQHHDTTSNFLQPTPSKHLSYNGFGGKDKMVPKLQSNVQNSFGPSLKEPPGAQRPSAFQQAMSTFQKPISPVLSQPSVNNNSVFNPAAPLLRPSPPQQTAPAFQKLASGVFSQTAPAFSSAVTAPASAFGGAFSAVFGKPSPSPSPALQEPSVVFPFATEAMTPSTALKAPNIQSQVPNQEFSYQSAGDQAEVHWQNNGTVGNWDNEEGQCEGEGVYYGEYNIDEDDELATKQADIARQQEEVAQKRAELDAQLEDAKRILVEKELAQQKKKEKQQSELRQRLLRHKLESHVAQHEILQLQQQQHQPPSPSLAVQDPRISVVSANPSSPTTSAFNPLKVVSSSLPQVSLPSPALNKSIASEPEQAVVPVGKVSTSNSEVRPLSTPPLEGPEILLERFSLYVSARMRYLVQAPNNGSRRNAIFELHADLQQVRNNLSVVGEYHDIVTTAFYNVCLSYAALTFWRKRAVAKVRKAKMAALRTKKQRLLAERDKGLGTREGQWVPVKIKLRPGDSLIEQGDLFRELNFDKIVLNDIFANPIQKAFTSRGIVGTNFSLLCLNAEPKAEYWWLRKFGISSGVGINVARRQKKLRNGNVFTVERVLQEPEPPVDVGALIFGCRADWSISNEERFKLDRRDLHFVVNYILRNCKYEKLVVMVISYRSLLDETDADPYGADVERTSGDGRKMRLKSVRKALGLNAFPSGRVVAKDIVLLETLGDMNLVPSVRKFAKTVAGVVGGEGLRAKQGISSKVIVEKADLSAMELVPYEEAMDGGEVNGYKNENSYRKPTKRKIPPMSTLTDSTNNFNLKLLVPPQMPTPNKRISTSPPTPTLSPSRITSNSALNTTAASRLPPSTKKPFNIKPSILSSDYFTLKSHGITVAPPVLGLPKSTPSEPLHDTSTNTRHGFPLPLLTRSTSAAASTFVEITGFTESHAQKQPHLQTRKRSHEIHLDEQDYYKDSSPPKRRVSEERECDTIEKEPKELDAHYKHASVITSPLYDFDNDPVVIEARRIREAPEYHPELEWPELLSTIV